MDPVFVGSETDCRAVLDVIEGDVRAYFAKDLELLSSFYLQEDRMISLMQIAGTGLIRCWGWQEF